MSAQFKYAFYDISEHLVKFIINFLQITVSVMLISYAVLKMGDISEFQNNISNLDNLENTYIMTDVTDEEHYYEISENDENLPRVREFYNYLKDSDGFDSYTFYSCYTLINHDSDEICFVDENFIKIFNLKDENGNSLKGIFSKDYGNYTPVIMGRGYKGKYNIGEIIESDDSKLIVAAFLTKNSSYFNLSWSKDPISLDAEIICPAMFKASDYVMDYLMAIEGTCIITEKRDMLDSISNKSKQLDLLDVNFKSLKTQVDNIRNDELESFQIAFLTMCLILSLCVACMASSLLTFVEEHLKEFAVHLLSGATIGSIIGRIFIQVGAPIILANIVAYITFRDLGVNICVLVISAMLLAIITVIPVVKIHTLGINGILKRCE